MSVSITDVESFKAFLRERAQETWDHRAIPYYLSMVATDLKRLGLDYHTYTGALRLAHWAAKEKIPDTKLVAHPTVKAKVGLLPANVDYDFSNEYTSDQSFSKSRSSAKRGQALIKFVESLSVMPEDAVVDFEVPAKILIALLKKLMTLIVAFVTADAAVIETTKERKTALLPNELRADGFAALGGLEVVVTTFDTKISRNQQDLLAWLDWEAASGVVLLTDDSMPGLIGTLGDQFSVHRFDPPDYGKKVANQLTATIARCLRAFRYLSTRFDDGKYQQIFRLPLRNFDAPEIARMRELCRDMMHRNYGREIDQLLKDMRERQKPKKASDYPDVYFVDDDGKHFQLGPEHHAQAETAIPPHNALCLISNRLRFGRRFDGTTHYNVSRDKSASMKGIYPDCHGTDREHGKDSHINMFTSDYF